MTKWEYKIMEISHMKEILNEQGEEGWELVTAYKMRNEFYPDFESAYHYCIFKRPKSEYPNDIL